MRKKPRIFIGSSSENVRVANAIQENLERDALCKVWTQGIFELSENALGNLVRATKDCDYAIFVFQPDDTTQIRDEKLRTVRDNLIFELGLFIGELGKDKVFFVIPSNVDKLHLPTDLLGIEPGRYEHPENEEDLLQALGPFCNKIRKRTNKTLQTSQEESQEVLLDEVSCVIEGGRGERSMAPELAGSKKKTTESGVSIDEFGNCTISIAPTVFFSDRISRSFPGIRGLHWFCNPEEATERLELLLKKPLRFEKAVGHCTATDPVWWFRGLRSLHIEKFERLNGTRCLLDVNELEIGKLAVYRSDSYYRSFVYVETKKDESTGVYELGEEDLRRMRESFGYAWEEFGLLDAVPITRECYDDAAATIDGEVVDASGAELRTRYLSKYNFLITSKFSPVNSQEFDGLSEPILNGVLKGVRNVEELVELVESLLRHIHDQ